MKTAIVDDDAVIRRTIAEYMRELLGTKCETVPFSSGEEFLKAWESGAYDLIILDIFMDKLNGMDIARKIRETDKCVKIVFATTSNEFASESYEVNACYYLRKPFGIEQMKAMLGRLNISEIEKTRTVKLPDGSEAVLRDIIYADFANRKVALHRKRGGELTVSAPFCEIEALLRNYPYFISPSKGIIVNFYEVSMRSADTFTMSDGTIIPISRRKSKEVIEAYSCFRFEVLRNGGER